MAELPEVIVVTGPPCGGKSTHITEHADPTDVVIDLDHIATALGYPTDHIDWSEPTPHPARSAAMIARASLVKATLDGKLRARRVWIVDAVLSEIATVRYRRAGATFARIDPGPAECHRRATTAGRPPATHDQIDRWYGDLGTTSTDW